jgi:16S rRNA (cytidine1402-2'-O)-methyltransferase
VEVVPGPSAVTSAVALSGVEAAGFLFGGFLPARPAASRDRRLAELLNAAGQVGVPLVLFEAPHRMADLLRRLAGHVPDAAVSVSREISKRHEETLSGTTLDVAARLGQPRGEFTLVVSGLRNAEPVAGVDPASMISTGRRLGLTDRALVEMLRAAGIARRDAYRLVREDT